MSLRLTCARLATTLALSLLLVSCGGGDRTSIQVVVSSSTLEIGEDVDRLQFEVVGAQSGQMLEDTFEIDGDWPQSLTILPGESDREQVTIGVRALLGDELVVAVTRSPSGDPPCPDCQFVPGEVQEVFVSLEREGTMDGGMDAGMDGGRDAMAEDAKPDAPPDGGMDAGDECASDEDCDDGVECTVDQCADGLCTNTVDDSVCAEGESCDATMGCPLRTCEADADCDDGDPCNTAEVCPDGRCRRGMLPAERCNGEDDDCDDVVDEDFDCVQGETGLECTTTCDTTGTRRCDVDCNLTTCEPPFETCNETDDDCDGVVDEGFACMSCTEDADCDDGNPCNGAETCSDRDECQAGTPRSCDDGVRCTVDDCDPDVGCTHTPEDGFCDDGNFCDGSEVCSETGCQPGTPPDCDDGDDCTDDSCSGTMPGMCTHTTVDLDGDGFGDASCPESGGVPATDCNDSDETVNPDATETCNGVDDDCDGSVDEDFECAPGTGEECTTSCGTTGMRACDDSCMLGDTCMPPPEACNGEDDDCDGAIDETVECTAGETGSCTTSCGSTGSRTCQDDCIWTECMPPAETCNGMDDDCDALVDEDFTCVPGSMRSCTTSCSTSGQQTCQSDCTWGTCEPPAESCNGIDDDCDGTCDNGFACCAGSSGSCTTSCGTTGTRTCDSECGWSACSPPSETCNGVDDDCNGECDDGFTCCAGTTGSCTTSCGSTGSRDCQSDCTWTSCMPPAETCSGADDDCDGAVDEGFTCVQGETESCTTSCGSTGSRTCQSDCTWSACEPPDETCDNGADDDCDGAVDCDDSDCSGHSACGCGTSCSGSTSVSPPGGRYTVSLGAHDETGSCGGAGSEAYLHFTLSSQSDVFITTHNTVGMDTVLYLRECSCTGSELACNDDADGFGTSALQVSNLAAGDYFVFVDTKADMTADVDVDIYMTEPGEESNRCGYPRLIPSGATSITDDSCLYTRDYDIVAGLDGQNCPAERGGDHRDQVYYFVLTSSSTVSFDGCVSPNYDSTVYIRDDCEDSSSSAQVACNDDGCGGGMGCNKSYRSSLSTDLGAGLYYYFQDGWDISCGCDSYDFAVSGI